YSFDVYHAKVAVGDVIRRLSPDHWNGKLHTSKLAREPSFLRSRTRLAHNVRCPWLILMIYLHNFACNPYPLLDGCKAPAQITVTIRMTSTLSRHSKQSEFQTQYSRRV